MVIGSFTDRDMIDPTFFDDYIKNILFKIFFYLRFKIQFIYLNNKDTLYKLCI